MIIENPFLKDKKRTHRPQTYPSAKNCRKMPSSHFTAQEKKSSRQLKDEYEQLLASMFNPATRDDYIVLDTETTGVGNDARIIEISMIDMNGNLVFSSLINPMQPINEKITEITGITNEELSGKPSFVFFSEEIMAALKGKHVICWNARFDQERVEYEFSALRKRPDCSWHCAMKLYHVLKLNGSGRWPKLSAAMEAEGIPSIQSHRSLGDCHDTLHVLQHLSSSMPVQYGFEF